MPLKIIRTCAVLWSLGILGMFLTRGLGHGPGDLGFEVCARAWGIGGLGYILLGALHFRGTASR